MLEILPYYLLGFLGLYVYFSVSGLVDMDGKYRKLRINLTDYLENHMAPRLAVLEEAGAAEKGKMKTSCFDRGWCGWKIS
jgi:hypothetical protein